jgi:uncharacterized protein YutE (UPF0331/DUF86 family)
VADRDLLDAKVESIERCLKRIEERTPATPEALEADYDAQDIISVNLQRAVQLSVDLASHLITTRGWPAPDTMGAAFTTLEREGILDADLADRLRRAVGFRNVSVHEYEEVDWRRVYSMVTERLGDFRDYAERVVHAWEH